MSMDADLHIHTKYSFDSFLEPKTVVKLALKRGLSAIAITDHNTIKGSLMTKQEASSVKDLAIISGIEVKTDLGDVIGLFVQDEVKARKFQDVVEEIRRQNGLVVLPHPYNGHEGVVEELISDVDVVECLNGRSSCDKNAKALRLAKHLDKPAIACSDAHFSFEIGYVKTKFYSDPSSPEEWRELILHGNRELIGKESSFIVHGFSFTAEILKRLVGLY
ncbi:MAG: PHP domain-containing protein [Candidatus Bathyarchaeia archaeon]